MKLTRLMPAILAVGFVAGSAALAQDTVRYGYSVNGMSAGCGAVLSQPAVVAPSCGEAIAPSCGAVLTQPAVIGGSCDPYAALWQRSVLDYSGAAVTTMPVRFSAGGVMTNSAIIGGACDTGCGVLTQPAVINGCGSVLTQPAVMTPNVINQPVWIQGTNPYDIRMMTGTSSCATLQQPAVIEQPQTTTETTTIRTVKTIRTRWMERRIMKHHACRRVVKCHRVAKRCHHQQILK